MSVEKHMAFPENEKPSYQMVGFMVIYYGRKDKTTPEKQTQGWVSHPVAKETVAVTTRIIFYMLQQGIPMYMFSWVEIT